MKILNYNHGQATEVKCDRDMAVIEVVLDDDRRVQLSVDADGSIHLRGWGNHPNKVGNADSVSLRCQLAHEEPHENWREKYGIW